MFLARQQNMFAGILRLDHLLPTLWMRGGNLFYFIER